MARTSRKQGKVAKQAEISTIKIALYARLSNEDNGGKSKDSIDNQLELLMDFIRRFEHEESFSAKKAEDISSDTFVASGEHVLFGKKVETIETYVDNGQTGTDFFRPGWERMIEDAKKGRINCIVVKDLSRFARNYLEAGDYLEKIFPFLGIRFIAVNDHFDSEGEIFQKRELITEFKNLANDYYSKDISKKVMSAFQTKKEQGQFIGSKAPYGYLLEDNHFVIDEPAAEIVKRIFVMKIQGMSAYKIAKILNQEGIPSPSRYAGERGMKKYRNCKHILWQPSAISRILYNRVYIGDLVQGKYNHSIYSKERRGKRAEDTWEVMGETHPAIIDQRVFQKVQKIKEKNRKIWQDKQGGPGYENVLEGILVCGICYHVLRRNKDIRKGKAQYYFYCGSAYNYSQVKCDTSSIIDYKIFDVILKQIKLQIELAVEVHHLIEQMKNMDSYSAIYQKKKREVEQIKDDLERYVYLKNSIYEDMKQEILTREEFLHAKEKYVQKIFELKKDLSKKEKKLTDFERCMNGENQWMNVFLSFRDTQELTREMAVKLLEKVEVYSDKRIHIKFRFRNEYEHLTSVLQKGCGVIGE